MNVLDEIVAGVLEDLAVREAALPLDKLKEIARSRPAARDAVSALRGDGSVTVIAECKRRSPSKGALADVPDPAVNEDLPGIPEVGAPKDLGIPARHVPERATAVEHDEAIPQQFRRRFGQFAPRRDVDRLAHPVRRDRKRGAQRHRRGDSRDRAKLEFLARLADLLEHPKRRVVQRGVSPH